MFYRSFIIIIIAFVSASAPISSLEAQPQGPSPQQEQQQEEAPPVLAVPKGYKYDSRGRRDPFINPVPKPASLEPEIPAVRPPGLKGVLINEAVVSGVVTSKEPSMNVVAIQAPGGRTYFARRGDSLFDAIIKEIRSDSVVFTVATPGRKAAAGPSQEVMRKVRPTP